MKTKKHHFVVTVETHRQRRYAKDALVRSISCEPAIGVTSISVTDYATFKRREHKAFNAKMAKRIGIPMDWCARPHKNKPFPLTGTH